MKDIGKIDYLIQKMMMLLIISSLIFSISCNRYRKVFLVSIPELADSLPLLNIDKSEYIETVKKHNIIMFHYFDGNCSSCIADLKMRSHYVDSIYKDELGLIFIAHAEDTVLLNYYLIDRFNFKVPVFYDSKSLFYQWNKKYIDKGIVTFLVNRNGRILISGDPTVNKEIENKYIEYISNHD